MCTLNFPSGFVDGSGDALEAESADIAIMMTGVVLDFADEFLAETDVSHVSF